MPEPEPTVDDILDDIKATAMEMATSLSALEGFVWLLHCTDILTITENEILVKGQPDDFVPVEFAPHVFRAVKEFQETTMEVAMERARERGILDGGG